MVFFLLGGCVPGKRGDGHLTWEGLECPTGCQHCVMLCARQVLSDPPKSNHSLLAEVGMFVSPKFICWNPKPHCSGVRRWGLGEVMRVEPHEWG